MKPQRIIPKPTQELVDWMAFIDSKSPMEHLLEAVQEEIAREKALEADAK